MEKPMILKIKETEESIVKIINEAGIPAFLLKNCIEKIYNQLVNLEANELEMARAEYEKSNKKTSKKEGEK